MLQHSLFALQVEEFRTPEFDIKCERADSKFCLCAVLSCLSCAEEPLFFNSSTLLNTSASYYTGGPLADAK